MNAYLLTIPDHLQIEHMLFNKYNLHKYIYSMFDQHRTDDELNQSKSSEINWLEVIRTGEGQQILIHSKRPIHTPPGVILKSTQVQTVYEPNTELEFSILINTAYREGLPIQDRHSKNSGKLKVLKKPNEISEWFCRKAPLSGFSVGFNQVDFVMPLNTQKPGAIQNIMVAHIAGKLKVEDTEKFKKAMELGIGRARTFGCGLLQVRPLRY